MIKLLLIFAPFIHNDSCRNDYLDKVLSSHSSYEYFVCLKVKYENVESEYFINNLSLRKYLIKRDSTFSDSYYYRTTLKYLINGNKALDVGSDFYLEKNFHIIIPSDDVDSIANKGKNYFLKKFFNKYDELLIEVPAVNIGYIIKKLFEWNIPVGWTEPNANIMIDQLSWNCSR